ncbi:SdrD B-like domain-containing protein [Microbacterium testaceum]|uniref:SdrD B-like domain-containing protein n=1 Tax=Microbacterium testaceum TaxID=2033 RepID=UPI00381170EB
MDVTRAPQRRRSGSARRWRAPLAILTAAALIVGGAVASVATSSPASAATSDVSGTVFRDFNGDGVRNTGNAARTGLANDTGLGGVTVTATDGRGTVVAQTTSANDGTYDLATSVAAGTPLRVQFSGWPAEYQPSGTAGSGATNGTSVQFVTAGATSVDMALNIPADYAQNSAPLLTAIQRAGLPNGAPASAQAASLVGLPYAQNGTGAQSPGFAGRVTVATFSQTGAIGNAVFQPASNSAFVMATYKRQSGLGSLGLGGIYRVTDLLGSDNTVQSARTVTPWLDVTTLGIDLGTVPTNAQRGLSSPTTSTYDPDGFAQAAKVGFGGAALSDDGHTLFFVNLHDKKLYAIDVSNPSVPPTSFRSWDLGLGVGKRPWAVNVHQGQLYVGVSDSGENAAGAQPGKSASSLNMTAQVLSTSATQPGTFTSVLTAPLGYTKGPVYEFVGSSVDAQQRRWNSWTDTWAWNGGSVAESGGGWHVYPQPILSGLYFDENGYLTLGFLDRTSVQGGNRNWSTNAQYPGFFETGSGGDILIAAPTASGQYTLENNAKAGARTGVTGQASEGPGGREFYNDSNVQGRGGHHEIGLGSLTGQRGTGEVVSTVFDPLNGIRLSGLDWFSTGTGAVRGGYELTTDGSGTSSVDGGFQKGGGLGTVSLLARSAPVEIGNRVWFDADQNGIQDADEPAIQGVTVQLFVKGSNTPLATQTTDAQGQYYFRSDRDGFDPNGSYTVRFVQPAQGSLALTGPNATTFGTIDWSQAAFAKTGVSSTTGSVADPTSGSADVTLRGPGMNVDDLDAGFVAQRSVKVSKVVDPSGGAPAAGQTFTIDVAARDFRGDPITLPQSTFALADGASSTDVTVPVGAGVRLTENDPSTKSVAITDPTGAPHTDWYSVTGTGQTLSFRVSNTLYKPGSIEITKAVTGAFSLSSPELADAVFTVAYSYTGGSGTATLNQANGWKSTVGPLPYGAQVTLSETAKTGQAASVGFGTPTWSTGGQNDGTAKVTVGDGTTTAVTLTNPTSKLVGGFTVEKQVTGSASDRVPAGTTFTVEYSLDNGTTWTALTPIADGATAAGPSDIAAGTTVLLREASRTTIADVAWQTPVFSGTGVTAAPDGTASLVIADGVTAAVGLQNPTEPRNGQFSVTKDVTGPGTTLVSGDPDYTVDYSSSKGSGTLTVKNGKTTSSPALPTGTVVTLTEVAPTGTLPAGAAWGTPVLRVNGQNQPNGSTITIGDNTVVAVTVENPTTVTPSVDIRKGDGTAATATITHEADTAADGQTFRPGETRDVVIRVTNTGPEALREVVVTDETLSGAAVTNLVWTAPDGTVLTPVAGGATSTARWDQTFGSGTASFRPGDVIVGRATLTVGAADSAAHQDRAAVSGVGALSGTPVTAKNDYNAFVGGIQVIKYDGQKTDPAVKDASGNAITPAKPLVDPAQDANTSASAVSLPVDTARPVRWVVTNTGDTWLTDVTLTDTTLAGPAIGSDWTADLSSVGGPKDYSFAKSGPWRGPLAPGASFFATGSLTMPAQSNHADRVDVVGTVVVPATDGNGVPTDQPSIVGGNPVTAKKADGSPFTVIDDDPFNAKTGVGPLVDIRKGDGSGTAIAHEADTADAAEAYQPGETRTIVFRASNTGDEPLVDVVLTDRTFSGGEAAALVWTLPDGASLPATWNAAAQSWTATWSGPWAPGAVITGSAQLTLGSASAPHVDRATVDAQGQASGKPVTSSNDYHAFTGGTQVVKYDGQKADPAVKDASGGWITPAKPLVDAAQDANDADHAVEYPVLKAEKVRWVVTNTGATWLTDLSLKDTTLAGPAIGDDWTADLSAFGGPKAYSFTKSGSWTGALPPGASFFAEGTLTLPAQQHHTDRVDLVGTVVVPAVAADGVTPTGQPMRTGSGALVTATLASTTDPTQRVPFTVGDNDPFNARSGVGPFVDIEKGDGSGTTIANDADTMGDAQQYAAGESRTIVFRVNNTGDEDLVKVVLTDATLSGTSVQSLVWTLPDGTTLAAQPRGGAWVARWDATFSGGAVWKPGQLITGTATLAVGSTAPHVDRATVDAEGAASGIPVTDDDTYNAFASGIQVIKYDGAKPDPAVKDAAGGWITPAKPLVDTMQDANTRGAAVSYTADKAGVVRWVVTNTGSTWLTSLDVSDVTGQGPKVSSWTADLSAFGGPAAYDFVTQGTWHGLIPPGASFFAQGALTMGAGQTHADTVTVDATPIVPAVDRDGKPTGRPLVDASGSPVPVRDAAGAPVRLSDSDPFWAVTPSPLAVTGLMSPLGGLLLIALVSLFAGAGVWILRRRKRVE